jgi:ribonuclease HI
MDNSEVELDCVNKLKLKCAIHEMNENYMLQKRVKRFGSFTNYVHKEEAQKFCRMSDPHEKQKKVYTLAIKRKSFDSSSQLGFNTYKKRAGTTDLDKDYEKLMCALFALKFSTSDIVADFEMKTNDHNYGCFDDVVLTVTFVDGQSQMFLLQLKHSEKKKTVNASKLAADNNDFSLSKYIESIPKIKITKNTSFILYTNSKTSIKSDIEIILQIENMTNEGTKNKDNKNKSKKNENKKIEGKKVVVRELPELDLEKLLLTNRDEISNKTEGTKVFPV